MACMHQLTSSHGLLCCSVLLGLLLCQAGADSLKKQLSTDSVHARRLPERRSLGEMRMLQQLRGSMPGSSNEPTAAAGGEDVNPTEAATDDRALVRNTTAYPFNAVGLIRVNGSTGIPGLCSGGLIGPNLVLTAAHCIHDVATHFTRTTGDFTPGFNPESADRVPYGTAKITDVFVPPEFINCDRESGRYTGCHSRYDFALLEVDTDFESYFGYSWDSTDDGGAVVNTAGYPGDDPDCGNPASEIPGQPFSGCRMAHTSCEDSYQRAGAATGAFPCYSFEGQSGSPVWLFNTTTNQRTVRGVLTFGYQMSDESDQVTTGFTVMSEDHFNEIAQWRQDAEVLTERSYASG